MGVIIDAHCDSLNEAYKQRTNLDSNKLQFNIKDAPKPYIQFLASFINTKEVADNVNNGYKFVNRILDYWYNQYENFKNRYDIQLITNQKDIKLVTDKCKLGIVLTTENGAAIGEDINNIQKLYERGIRVMGITWNDDNLLGSGTNHINDLGLSRFGINCIKEMNRLNVIIDVSHTSPNTFFDVMTYSFDNVIATHSNAYSVYPHPRNLTDDQIKEIAKHKGVIGINLYSRFVKDHGKASIDEVVDHIVHISDLVGIDYVGIGTDFDGIPKEDLPNKICGVNDIAVLENGLYKRGFRRKEIEKIMGLNMYNILVNNLK